MMQTIKLIHQYTYGMTTCAMCRTVESIHLTKLNSRTGKRSATNASLSDVSYFAYKNGWRQLRNGNYVCPKHIPALDRRKPIPKKVKQLAEIRGDVIE